MKKSLYLFITVMACLFLVDRGVYFGLHTIEEKVTTGQSVGKVNYFNTIKDSVDNLVFGSSRAVHHVNTNYFKSSVFNMGADGTKIGYAAGLISTLKKKNQTILVHIDHNTLFSKTYKGGDMLSLINETRDNEELKRFLKENYKSKVVTSQVVNSFVYNGKVLGIIKNYLMPKKGYDDQMGFAPIVPSENQKKIFKKLLAQNKAKLNSNIYKPLEVNIKTDKFINQITNIINQNKSRLIFFTSPSLHKVDEEVKLKIKNYFLNKGITYFDHIDVLGKENKDFWKDFTHLSEKGSVEYTRLLLEKLNNQ